VKKRLIFIFLAVFVTAVANAQQLVVRDGIGNAVSQALVSIFSLDGSSRQVFFSDNQGRVTLTGIKPPFSILVTHVSFKNFSDTLKSLQPVNVIVLTTKNINVGEVVVTAEYAAREARESVHPVMVIGRQQIEQQAAVNLGQLLEQQSGIRISRDMVLGASVSLNGMSGQNIKFLVDGVPVTGRLDGNIDAGQLNLNHVERIEVVNGLNHFLNVWFSP
jgi:outer membrane receptor for ferrienterochelin and colicins